MIDKICGLATNYFHKYDGMPEKDVIEYSLKFILTNIITFLLIIALGLTTGNIINVLIAALSFSLLRVFSGGIHIKNPDLCILTSLTVVYALANLPSYISPEYVKVFMVITFLLVIIYAPSKIEDHSILRKEKHYIFKIISIIIVFAGIIGKNEIIQFSFFVQSLTLINIRMKGGEINE